MRPILSYYLSALVFTFLPALASASDSSAFITQVTRSDAPAQENGRQVANFSTPGTGQLGSLDIDRLALSNVSASSQHGTLSVTNQQGRNNRLSVVAIGKSNITLQHQQGVGNTSDIALAGQRNAISVDQRGNYLDSDIQVVGSNKVIFHFQRGNGQSGNQQPLLYTGNQREAQVILDTPKGRLTKTIAN
ncbi:hypothetical protein SAMN05216571_104234 [Onishia taeanensis]|uniref:Curlin associated repeat-containing protein n=1 Tax=Onishia taeanensis TaxID=284577 RepID=A0A1G7RFC7_9GAMM|nr:hypothetical protein [Halomonas taeanensis]SDG09458.1 hypothetical protein SAMN05216571_104234 [Halomonas taeanensis]